MQPQSSLKSGLINPYNLSWKCLKDHSKAFTHAFAMIGQYVGGGIKIAPMAVVDDGYMDVLFVEQLTRRETLKLLPKPLKVHTYHTQRLHTLKRVS